MNKVAVVILNWNGLNLLKEYLPRVLDNTDPDVADVIVADNGSTDASVEYLHWLGVQTIEFKENYGFAGGYNRAIDRISSPYTVLLNSDVAPAPGWINILTDFMESHSEVGAVQPKILSWHNQDKFEYAGASGGFLDRNGYPYCRGRIFGTVETDHGQYDTPIECDWVTGAAMMVRTDVYKSCGGLDTDFFAHMEEIDLCWRMRLAGWKLMAIPAATVYHLGGGSLPMGNPRKTYLNFRNNLLLLHKNLPHSIRNKALTRRRLLDTIAWARAVASFNWADARAIVRAHRDYSKMRAAYSSLKSPSENLIANRPNILTEYFLRRHTSYASLTK
ncbi:MAG: glycosyltransferase family 2 protein [Muribaculaceae bacterium]|nr:glycosyltransferase family 2 protein [Muribaculaceae bacterium]